MSVARDAVGGILFGGVLIIVGYSLTAAETGQAQGQGGVSQAASTGGKPRKVIVGTSMYGMWGGYPGLTQRLAELGSLVDSMAAQAKTKYGRSIDIAALPEVAVSGGLPNGPSGAFPLQGQVQDYFAALARKNNCYIVAPLFMSQQENGKTVCYNVCALIGRQGEVVGIYRKVHPVSSYTSDVLEGGVLPGKDFPVFQCDFGKVGIQICYDMSYEDGWLALGKQGAELVIWSSQSPGQVRAANVALDYNYYVVSSTWRNNASLYDPMGMLVRSITQPTDRVFAEEIDLEYVLLPWQPALNNGKIFDDRYPGKVGYRYSEAEDEGIFWSKDLQKPIMEMVRELGLMLSSEKVEKDRLIQDRLRGGPPQMPIMVSASLDWGWVYQNAPVTTGGRNASRLTISIDDDLNGNTSYAATVGVNPASPGAVTIGSTVNALVWTVRGGQVGRDPVGDATLDIAVAGVEHGGSGSARAKVAVRLLGDVDGNGLLNDADKAAFNSRLNNFATGYPDRAFDLNGDGAVGGMDKLILNKLLNGFSLP